VLALASLVTAVLGTVVAVLTTVVDAGDALAVAVVVLSADGDNHLVMLEPLELMM